MINPAPGHALLAHHEMQRHLWEQHGIVTSPGMSDAYYVGFHDGAHHATSTAADVVRDAWNESMSQSFEELAYKFVRDLEEKVQNAVIEWWEESKDEALVGIDTGFTPEQYLRFEHLERDSAMETASRTMWERVTNAIEAM